MRTFTLQRPRHDAGWQLLERLPSGHRLFSSRSTHVAYAGKVAIADESGATPDTTDDGELWLDTSRPLVVDALGRYRSVTLPLFDTDGDPTRTVVDTATALVLSAKYGMEIQIEGGTHDGATFAAVTHR